MKNTYASVQPQY